MDPNINLNDESIEDWPEVAKDAATWVIGHKNSEYLVQLPEDRKGWLVEQVEQRLKSLGEL